MMNPNWFSAATPKATEPVPGPMPESMRRAQGAKTKEGDPIPVVIYVRVSSNVQDIKNSIEAQIEECLRYARANNMIVVAIYRDEAFTGTISSRPGFQSLIADATNPDTEFHTILVWKLSRFARNKYDSVTYEHMLEKRGIKVISVTEPIDDSPAGEMLRGFIQALDAYYSSNLSQEVRRGQHRIMHRGFYPRAFTCYGYKLEKVKESDGPAHNKIVLDPPKAEVIRRLFLEATAGRTTDDIREGLHKDSIPSPNGKDWWPPSTIDTILVKLTYAGYGEWGISSKKGEEPLIIPDHHEGIVTPEEYLLAQQSRAGRAKSNSHPRAAGSDRMLSEAMECWKCGKTLQARPRGDHSCDYVCETRRHGGHSACPCPNIASKKFEPVFLKAVTEDILSPTNMKTLTDIISRELKIPYKEQISKLELISKELEALEKKQERVMTAYEAGAYTVENFTKRMEPLRNQKVELLENKTRAGNEINREAAIVTNPQMVIDFAKNISALIKHSHPKEQKELLKKFIKTVVISPGKATIHYRIPMPRDGRNPRATKRELALKGEPVSIRPTAHMTPADYPVGVTAHGVPGSVGFHTISPGGSRRG